MRHRTSGNLQWTTLLVSLMAILLGSWLSTIAIAKDAESTATVPTDIASLRLLECRVRSGVQSALRVTVAVEEAMQGPVEPGRRTSFASGVIISADGLILSQYHVSHLLTAQDGRRNRKPGESLTVILHDGHELKAELLCADCSYDVSLLRIVEPNVYPHTPIADSTSVKLGDGVLKLGHPSGYRPGRRPVVRFGHVLCRDDNSFITDCRIVGGDSGGPLFDLDGHLIGILRSCHCPTFFRKRPERWPRYGLPMAYTSSSLIRKRLPSMLKG